MSPGHAGGRVNTADDAGNIKRRKNMESEQLRSRVVELCRRMLGRDAFIYNDLESGTYQLRYTQPTQRTPARMNPEEWTDAGCDIMPETYEAAWKGTFTDRQPVIGLYESNARRATFGLKSAGRRLVRSQPTQIVDIRHAGEITKAPWFDAYCGRPSPLGNPFKIDKDTPDARRAAVERYASWIETKDDLRLFAGNLRGLRLGCWCLNAAQVTPDTPATCHCVVIARIADAWEMDAKGFPKDANGVSVRFVGQRGSGSTRASDWCNSDNE